MKKPSQRIFTFIKVMKELRWLTSLTFILTIYTAGANIDLSSNINDKLTNTSNISDKGSKGEIGSVDHEIFV